MRHVTMLVAILAFVPLASATAQVPIRPGARVRVTRPPICRANTICVGRAPRQRVGTFLAWRSDTIVVQSNGDTLSVPVDLVTRLDVVRGQKSNTIEGAIIGLLVGGVAGAAMVYASDQECESPRGEFFSCTVDISPLGGALSVGLTGGVVGALIGLEIQTDRWQEVQLHRLRVNLAPQRDGRFGLGASVRF